MVRILHLLFRWLFLPATLETFYVPTFVVEFVSTFNGSIVHLFCDWIAEVLRAFVSGRILDIYTCLRTSKL